MTKRIGLAAACLAALALCSCAEQAEVERARAEAERAKAEAAEARAEAEALKARLDAQEGKAAKEKAAQLEEELRNRWNEVGPKYAVGNFGTFKWPGPDAFPHPTYKGGSKEAYTEFAKALVEFLETGDNFEFMAKNDLFNAEIGFALKGKVKLGEFAAALAKPDSLGSGDEANRKKLEALVAKMKAPRKV